LLGGAADASTHLEDSYTVPRPRTATHMPHKMPGSRFLAEGAVIVASILLAFVIDAGWQGSQDREETREMLAAVRTELVTSIESLEHAAARYSEYVDAASQLLTLTGPDADIERIEAAARPIGILMVPAGIRLPDAAMATLISSGRLARLDDAQLRQALSGWRETISGMAGTAQITREAWTGRAWPVILEHVPQLDLEHASGFAAFSELRERFTKLVPESSRFASDYAGLLGDMRFESAVVQVMTLALISENRIHTSAIPDAEVLLSQIERALAGN